MNLYAPVIPLHLHPLGYIEAFTRFGAPLAALLRDTGINRSMLQSHEARISYAQQQKLVDNGIALCRKPGIGLLVGEQFDWSYYGTIGTVSQCSPSLRAAKDLFYRYVLVLQPGYGARTRPPQAYVDENGFLIYPLQWFSAPNSNPAREQFEFELRLAVTLRFWNKCGNPSVPDPSVHVFLAHPEPVYAEIYRRLPHTTLKFGCGRSYLAVRPDFMNKPFRPLRKPLFDRIVAQCEAELRVVLAQSTYERKVRWYLCSRFNAEVTLSEIAGFLQMTSRTLTRRLAEEGTSFRRLAHQVRMEAAMHYLHDTNLTVERVAELTGFASALSLHRALRNWRLASNHASRNSRARASIRCLTAS